MYFKLPFNTISNNIIIIFITFHLKTKQNKQLNKFPKKKRKTKNIVKDYNNII